MFIQLLVEILILIFLTNTNYVFSLNCKYYPYYPLSNGSLIARNCDYCCFTFNRLPTTVAQACCQTNSGVSSEYWWISLIIIIPMIIIFFACVFCMYLKKSHNNVCGFSYGSCPRCDTNCSCDLFSNCCRKSQRIGDVNSRKTLSTTKPIVNPPKPSIKIENEKPPSYEEFAKQNAVIQIEQTDGANPLPVLPAPVIKNI